MWEYILINHNSPCGKLWHKVMPKLVFLTFLQMNHKDQILVLDLDDELHANQTDVVLLKSKLQQIFYHVQYGCKVNHLCKKARICIFILWLINKFFSKNSQIDVFMLWKIGYMDPTRTLFLVIRRKWANAPFKKKKKKPAFCPISQTNQGNAPLLKLDFLKIELSPIVAFLRSLQ